MDREIVYKMGVKCGLLMKGDNWGSRFDALMKFADLVAAAEREECARVAAQYAKTNEDTDHMVARLFGYCADDIRSRGDK